jgi:hypothetical protein
VTTTLRAMLDGGAPVEWILLVAGLPVRYYSGPVPPPSLAVPGLGGTLYEDVPALSELGSVSERIEPARGWTEASTISVVLGDEWPHARTAYSPSDVFGALGRRSATSYAQIIDSVPASGAAVATLDRQWTGTIGALAHVDREAVVVTAASAAPPWTATLGVRAAAGSWPAQHTADVRTLIYSELTDRVIQWRGRPAYLFAAVRYPGASRLSTPLLWAPCVLGSTPTVDGARVTLELSSLTALVDRSVGGAAQTPRQVGLTERAHRFWRVDGADRACPSRWSCLQEIGSGVPELSCNASAAAQINLTGASYATHSAWFWAAGLAGVGAGASHPRWGDLTVTGAATAQQINGLVGAPVLSAPGAPGYAAGTRFEALPAEEVYTVDVVPITVPTVDLAWPEGLAAVFAARAAGTVAAQAGAWMDVLLDAAGGSLSLVPTQPWERIHGTARVWLRQSLDSATVDPRPNGRRGPTWQEIAQTWLPPRRWDLNAAVGSREPSIAEEVSYPLRIQEIIDDADGSWQTRRGAFACAVPWTMKHVGNGPRAFPIVTALGWHEVGEPAIFVDADPGIPAGGCWLAVEWTEPTGEARSAMVQATGAAVADLLVAVVPTYRIDLADGWAVPSFGSWPGQPPATITPVIAWGRGQRVTSGQLLLELLESGGGSGALGTYDRQPWGCGIPAALVDEDSFLSHVDPPGLDGWSLQILPESDLSEVLAAVLVVTGSQIVMRRTSTGAQLARVSVGAPVAASAVASLSDADCAALPASSVDEYTVSTYLVTTQEPGAEEPRETTWIDQRSAATHGEGQTLELDLRGLVIPPGPSPVITLLQPVIARIAAQYGSPRRVWDLEVSSRLALSLWPGADVLVSSRYLHGAAPRPGVSAAVARVTSLDVPLIGAVARLRLEWSGERATLINYAARVTATPAADVLRVSRDYYTDGADPATGAALVDVSWLAVGDVVYAHALGADDAGVLLTVAAVTPAGASYDVQTTAPHGLAAPAVLEPTTYDTAGAAPRVLAYLCDAAGTLGAAGVEAFVYA